MFGEIRNSISSLLLVILLLNTAVFAQVPADLLKPTMRSTNFLTPQQLSAMMLPGSPTAAATTNSLPFPVTKNYPAFFVIPPDKRPQVLNQGNCGSCTAWSTVTALATVVANQPNPPITLQTIAEPHNFYIMAGKRCEAAFKGDTEVGWWNYDATAAMKKNGVFLANILGGKASDGSTEMLGSADMWIKAGKEGAIGSKTVLPLGIDKFDAMRSFLSTQGALTANLAIFSDFNKYKSGVYNHKKFVDMATSVLEPHPSMPADAQQAVRTAKQKLTADLNKVDGGHAVTVIGYFTGGKITLRQAISIFLPPGVAAPATGLDLNTQFDAPAFWIVQNSWGTDFGAQGIFLYEAGQDMTGCGWRPASTCNLDDEMYYMLDPIVIQKGVQLGGSQSMLTGTWAMHNDKNVKYDKLANITHNGSNLTVDNGYGSVSTVQLNGSTFTSSGLNAKVSNDGNAITWSNGFIWKKQ
jgi:hypothetical protein